MFGQTAVISLKGCRGGLNEDTHIHIKDKFHINGTNVDIECWGIFDGHCGRATSEFLEKNSYEIFKKHCEKCITDINNYEQIKNAFKAAQIEWQLQSPNQTVNGATVIFTLIICDTLMTHNLSIGDGRFNYFYKKTGEIFETDIKFYDFIDGEEKKYYGRTLNDIHQINGQVLKNGERVNSFNIIKKKDIDYDEYSIENDVNNHDFNEWVKFNKYFDNGPNVIFPKHSNNCYRLICLQPTRTIGFSEKSLHLGTMMSFKINNEIKACLCCDGLDDNKAILQEDIPKILLNPKMLIDKLFTNHIAISGFNKLTNIPTDADIHEKVVWLRQCFEGQGHLKNSDNDWRRGLDSVIPFFRNLDMSDIKTIQQEVDFIANMGVARMSGDNITVALIDFGKEVKQEVEQKVEQEEVENEIYSYVDVNNNIFNINKFHGMTNQIRAVAIC
jgi:serine/threonine protein phosphatase PrpC